MITADKARKKTKENKALSDTEDIFIRSIKLNFDEQV